MARLHGSKTYIFIDDQAGTCRSVRGDTSSITVNFSKAQAEYSVMGANSVNRLEGLRDASVDVTSVWNSSASATEIIGLLDNMYAGSLVSRVQIAGGSAAGCPIYTGSMRMSTYTANYPVDGVATATYTMVLATGCMTAACQSG